MKFEDIINLPYKEMLSCLLKDAPTNCTWHEVSSWIDKKYSIEQIAIINLLLYKQLILLTPDDCEELPGADELRDDMDVWAYSGSMDLNNSKIMEFVKMEKVMS